MIGKKLINTGGAAVENLPSGYFNTVTYTGTGGTYPIGSGIDASVTINSGSANYALGSTSYGNNSGKRYFEVEYVTAGSSGTPTLMVGIINSAYQESWTNAQTKMYYANNGNKYTGGSGASYGATFDEGDVIGVAYDGTARTVTFYKNNVSQGTAFTGLVTGFPNYKPAIGTGLNSETAQFRFTTANFTYTPPTGYSEWGTSTVSAHSGTVQSSRPAQPINFQPDLVWIKNRSAQSHRLVDSVRGSFNLLFSDLTNANDGPSSGYPSLVSNGFQLNGNESNASSTNYVAWCFNAGTDAAASNTDGSITSTVKANQDAGFSIVKYSGNSTAGATVGHGLSEIPQMIIVKRLSTPIDNWAVYNETIGNTYRLALDESAAAAGPRLEWNSTNPTNTVFTLGNHSAVNQTSDYIAYCFHSVDGIQKVGSYTGTGAAGNSVVTGFEPAFVMVKRTDSASGWLIIDNKRGSGHELYPHSSSAELSSAEGGTYDRLHLEANGFTFTGSAFNESGSTWIYLAIAADPDTTTPTVEDSFEVVTYTGNGGTQSIDTGFKPDLVWTKPRSYADNNQLWDTIRGAGWTVYSNKTNAENPTIRLDGLSSFDSNGFTIGNWNNINVSGETYVAWCWKAGDHDDNLPQINTEGTIDSVVSVNDAAGFSIVKYTASGSSATVGHGLSATPDLIITKGTTHASSWDVWHKDVPNAPYLSGSDAAGGVSHHGTPDSTTFGITHVGTYNSGTYITYCFTSITGYQKIGSYSGGGTSDVTVTTNFQPRFIMTKRTDNTGNWIIFDSQRSTSATDFDNFLYPNLSDAEVPNIDAITTTSTGFIVTRNNAAPNFSGGTYIYLAIK